MKNHPATAFARSGLRATGSSTNVSSVAGSCHGPHGTPSSAVAARPGRGAGQVFVVGAGSDLAPSFHVVGGPFDMVDAYAARTGCSRRCREARNSRSRHTRSDRSSLVIGDAIAIDRLRSESDRWRRL